MRRSIPKFLKETVNTLIPEHLLILRQVFRVKRLHARHFILPVQKRKDDVLMPGHLHGAVSKLTELTGLQQQSIDKALKKSNIFVERNTAFALVEYLQRELKGGNE